MRVDEKTKNELIAKAKEARKNAYCPYSKFAVGAALLAKSGKIYCGSNFENASFGAGACAERVALGAALSAGERKFSAIAVCAGERTVTPCGICRQALCEFGDIEVICTDASGALVQSFMLSHLLPEAFTQFEE